MTLPEMHVWFRQYAQQMGMQNVRAILPEQIDVVINTSISDYVNEIIRTNIGLTNDRIITDNSKLGQINALRTLVDDVELQIGESLAIEPVDDTLSIFSCNDFIHNLETNKDMMYYIDCSIKYYKDTNKTNYTNWYPVRTIDTMYLADTLQDYILGPKYRSPIATISGGKLDLYLGAKKLNLTPTLLRVNIIKKPNKVEYLEDIQEGTSVNCNLPDYCHVDILKHAVDLYRVAIQGSLYANQQQQQAQQREVGRNNVRPDNEGYVQ